MGQQQILLTIFVTFIVGLATIVAINVFGNIITESNKDAVRQDLLIAATNAQQLHERPFSLDGISKNFNNMQNGQLIARINIPGIQSGEIIQNENGSYSISGKADRELRILGITKQGGDEIEIIVCQERSTSSWFIDIDSPTAQKPSQCD